MKCNLLKTEAVFIIDTSGEAKTFVTNYRRKVFYILLTGTAESGRMTHVSQSIHPNTAQEEYEVCVVPGSNGVVSCESKNINHNGSEQNLPV